MRRMYLMHRVRTVMVNQLKLPVRLGKDLNSFLAYHNQIVVPSTVLLSTNLQNSLSSEKADAAIKLNSSRKRCMLNGVIKGSAIWLRSL